MPAAYDDLLALPGVGDYTAAAVAAFAFGRRHVVLDTNVRRVLARLLGGQEFPAPSVTRAERARAESVLPVDEPTAATWSVARHGARRARLHRGQPGLRRPARSRTGARGGRPATRRTTARPAAAQAWAGTDRQCRGRLLAVLRETDGAVHASRLDAVWADDAQRARCLAGLLDDGLVARVGPSLRAARGDVASASCVGA